MVRYYIFVQNRILIYVVDYNAIHNKKIFSLQSFNELLS